MRVDDMRFQFHGGMSPEDAVDELYEALAGATFEEEHLRLHLGMIGWVWKRWGGTRTPIVMSHEMVP